MLLGRVLYKLFLIVTMYTTISYTWYSSYKTIIFIRPFYNLNILRGNSIFFMILILLFFFLHLFPDIFQHHYLIYLKVLLAFYSWNEQSFYGFPSRLCNVEVSYPVWQIKFKKIIRLSKNLKVIKPHKIKGLAPLLC